MKNYSVKMIIIDENEKEVVSALIPDKTKDQIENLHDVGIFEEVYNQLLEEIKHHESRTK